MHCRRGCCVADSLTTLASVVVWYSVTDVHSWQHDLWVDHLDEERDDDENDEAEWPPDVGLVFSTDGMGRISKLQNQMQNHLVLRALDCCYLAGFRRHSSGTDKPIWWLRSSILN